ncbi:MAG: VTT domain-containing protein [Gammaproteobacteria bacterium]|nr:VTT domain-containing protein [Gammaproteobacteria bacterium]
MKTKLLRVVVFVALLAGVALAVLYRDRFDAQALASWVKNAGAAAPLLFMLIYAVATVLFLPGSVITLAGGALFGPVLGTLYNLTGATLGATLAFLVSRYLASDWVAARTGGRLKQLINGVEGEGWRFVAFVRLVPLFPFNLLNYALGLTRIPLLQYVLASYICMLPGAIAYTYLGYAGREAVAGGAGLIQKGLLALALLAAVAFLPRLIGKLRKQPMLAVPELKRRLDAGEDLLVLDVRPLDGYTGDLGHIAGVTHIPLNELEQRIHELDAYQEKPIVTICRTDRMSTTAAQMLAQKGFANVCVAKQGMTDWNQNGYPIER